MRRGSVEVRRRMVAGQIAVLVVSLLTSVTGFSFGSPAAAATTTLSVPDTAYAIPSGALFVSPSGSDSNAGTQASPFATLTKAVAVVAAGGTIVMRAGRYHESINSVWKQTRIQAYPHEQVWLDGRIQVSSWSVSGSAWAHAGWNPGLCQTCFDPNAIQSSAPAAGLPDMVFVDGSPIPQVTSRSALTPGRFYVDTTNHVLYLGSNPAGHVVQAAEFAKAIQFGTTGAAGSMLRGIGVIGYASNVDPSANSAMVIDGTQNMTFENDVFAYSAATGLAVNSSGTTVRSSEFVSNGYAGLMASTADGLTIQSSWFTDSNRENFVFKLATAAGVAGSKITNSDNVTVKDSIFENNSSSGLWFDLSDQNVTVVRNVMQRNLWNGLTVELSDTLTLASNIAVDNVGAGFKVSGTSRAKVINNTLANNGTAQLEVYEDARTANATLKAQGITWDTANVTVLNNILASDNLKATLPLVHTFDSNSPKKVGASQMIAGMNYDVYARASTATPKYQAYWATLTASAYATNYANLATFHTGTTYETSGLEKVTYATSPLFVNENAGDYHLVTGSVAHHSGAALTAAVAAAIGVSAGVAVDRGALVWPIGTVGGGGTTVTTTTTTSTTSTTTTTVAPATTTTTAPLTTTTTSVPLTTTTTTAPRSTTTTTTVATPPPTTTTTVGSPPPSMPSVASVTPRSGPSTGAVWVTIYGSHFDGATAVRFGTVNATKITIVSSTKLLALAPTYSPTVVHVTVSSRFGSSAPSSADTFSFTATLVPTPRSGYWMLGADGYSYAFGNAHWLGNAGNPSVAIASRPDGYGNWIVDAHGSVRAFGTAIDYGGSPVLRPWEAVSTISSTPTGNGYWLFTNRGRAFAYGDAHFYGDMGSATLNGPIVASSATPTGHGYYMVGSDGGVFSFGDARFHGSTGGMRLSKPVVGIAPTADNKGYWLVASDGGVFAFNAPFRGSMGGTNLNKPVNGVVSFGNGYLMVASDGGVFVFSNKRFSGSRSGASSAPVVGIASFSS